jgi:predicted transcriptional regulator
VRVPGFGELEGSIMAVLGDADGPLTVREVHEALSGSRSLAYTTVMTVMGRLHAKGVLNRSEAHRAFSYEPVHSRADHAAHLMAQALADSHDRDAALVHFVDSITADEEGVLRAALRRRRKR